MLNTPDLCRRLCTGRARAGALSACPLATPGTPTLQARARGRLSHVSHKAAMAATGCGACARGRAPRRHVLLEGRVGHALPGRRQQLPDVRARHQRGCGAGLAGRRRRVARARGAAPPLDRRVRGGHEEVRRPRVALRRAQPSPPKVT